MDSLWEEWKLPLRRLLTTKRSVWATKRHALGIQNPMTPGHIDDPCARTSARGDILDHARVERTLKV